LAASLTGWPVPALLGDGPLLGLTVVTEAELELSRSLAGLLSDQPLPPVRLWQRSR
jgi:hypothetical protein